MAIKGISGFYWYLGVFVLLSSVFCFFCFSSSLALGGLYFGSFFVLDYVSFYLVLISLLLLISLFSWWGVLSYRCRSMLLLSFLSSFLCYCSLNVIVFWVSYELCILPLLFLLVSESSYSERFVAFWYLMGYVVLTSLPLLLSIFYLYGSWGGFSLCLWEYGHISWVSLFVLCVCFITKVPLPPFHVWLPIVHAEASSPVSVCLSGFIMKLGILGVFRFAYLVLPYSIFSFFYIILILSLSVGFLLLSLQELDGKRWLAILSLSHIVLASLGLMVVGHTSVSVPFIFCLGHGISAGLIFILLWLVYDTVGSRNWGLLKYGVGNSFFLRLLMVGCLCSAGSLPPTISFFSEVRILVDSGYYSFLLLIIFFCYLFFSGLIPLFILGSCLSRHFSVSSCGPSLSLGVSGLFFLCGFCYLIFLII